MKNRSTIFIIILSVLACFGLFSTAQADDEDLGGGNSGAGFNALFNLSGGGFNTALGWFSQFDLTTGSFNTAVGAGSLDLNNGDSNTAAGTGALLLNITATRNTAVGTDALLNNDFTATSPSTANDNTAVGTQALFSNKDGGDNTAIGSNALFFNDSVGTSPVSAIYNTAVGSAALFSNVDGTRNTAVGFQAMVNNDLGNPGPGSFAISNTAVGAFALAGDTTVGNTGGFNNAFGTFTLFSNQTGFSNQAMGNGALLNNTTGSLNVAVGGNALVDNTTGSSNVAIGLLALENNITGVSNTAMGDRAGGSITGSSNICIGAGVVGTAADVTTIRIGDNLNGAAGSQCFIGGITGAPNFVDTVKIDPATGQLGDQPSSQRFKKDIDPMAKTSEQLYSLKPVTFHYKNDKTNTAQFGLIAEEVAKVNPALIAMDKEGKPYTVAYDKVNAMLLNEFLKEHKKVEEQQATIAQLKSTVAQQQKGFEAKLAKQEEQIETLAGGLQKVSGELELRKSAPQTVSNNH